MPINNSKISFNGIDLQVNTNGVVAHKIQIVDDYMPWLSRSAITATREEDDSLGFDVTMLTGKRIRVYYGTSDKTAAVPKNNAESLSSLYRKVVQTSFDISGTGLSLTDAVTIFNIYRETQLLWGKRASLLAKMQDPDIPNTTKTTLANAIDGLIWLPKPLTIMGNGYQVIFGEGMTCQFTNWVIGDFTDFTFNFIQREPLT